MRISRFAIAKLSAVFCVVSLCLSLVGQAQAQRQQATYEQKRREANDIAVSIVVSGLSCTCARFAEDIRNVVNDLRPDGIRVLPVLGVGGLQNLNDVLFLKGIDMGVVEEDNLQILKQRNPRLYADLEQRVQYITKLYNSEFHVVARNDILSYEDLRGKKVSFNQKDSQTEVTAEIVFKMLNIDVEHLNYDNDEAIKKLRDGEISAMIVVSGAPQAALAKLTKQDGLHFLPLDEKSFPGPNGEAVLKQYQPTKLTADQYPALIPPGTSVPTVGNRALLVTYAWPENSARYVRMTKFVREFFGKIDLFQDGARHPKWREINIAADMPGWVRFRPATEWIAENRKVAALQDKGPQLANVKALFEQYLTESGATAGKSLSDNDRQELFGQFQEFLAARRR
ncbi:MAG TPA: TAXI family TRAP transporter solute-binding subunit [Bradyrhizobium sp.]|jgi:TRAP transporter TAXI family solute receptor|nr:TAXI family TRAP transporter solute-binding subunit [Bradyrhizobium sp.]